MHLAGASARPREREVLGEFLRALGMHGSAVPGSMAALLVASRDLLGRARRVSRDRCACRAHGAVCSGHSFNSQVLLSFLANAFNPPAEFRGRPKTRPLEGAGMRRKRVTLVQQGVWAMPLESMPSAMGYLKAAVDADEVLRGDATRRSSTCAGRRR